jgi:hypothetical protein
MLFVHVYDPPMWALDWQKLLPASLIKITVHGHQAVISKLTKLSVSSAPDRAALV